MWSIVPHGSPRSSSETITASPLGPRYRLPVVIAMGTHSSNLSSAPLLSFSTSGVGQRSRPWTRFTPGGKVSLVVLTPTVLSSIFGLPQSVAQHQAVDAHQSRLWLAQRRVVDHQLATLSAAVGRSLVRSPGRYPTLRARTEPLAPNRVLSHVSSTTHFNHLSASTSTCSLLTSSRVWPHSPTNSAAAFKTANRVMRSSLAVVAGLGERCSRSTMYPFASIFNRTRAPASGSSMGLKRLTFTQAPPILS